MYEQSVNTCCPNSQSVDTTENPSWGRRTTTHTAIQAGCLISVCWCISRHCWCNSRACTRLPSQPSLGRHTLLLEVAGHSQLPRAVKRVQIQVQDGRLQPPWHRLLLTATRGRAHSYMAAAGTAAACCAPAACWRLAAANTNCSPLSQQPNNPPTPHTQKQAATHRRLLCEGKPGGSPVHSCTQAPVGLGNQAVQFKRWLVPSHPRG